MKISMTLLVFMCCFLSQNISAQNIDKKQTDVQKAGLKGKVKKITLKYFYAEDKFGEIVQTGNAANGKGEEFYTQYNENGFITIHSEIGKDFNAPWDKESYKYNDMGKIIEHHIFEYNKKNGVYEMSETQKTYNYDGLGNKTEEIRWYEKNGNKIMLDTIKYIYDVNNNLLEKNLYSMGALYEQNIYRYDAKNNAIEDVSFNKGNFSNPGKIKSTYKFDANGFKVEFKKFSDDGSLIWMETYKNDIKGNVIEEKGYNRDGKLSENINYEYVYDQEGNWTKQIKRYEGSNRLQLRIREIEYYIN